MEVFSWIIWILSTLFLIYVCYTLLFNGGKFGKTMTILMVVFFVPALFITLATSISKIHMIWFSPFAFLLCRSIANQIILSAVKTGDMKNDKSQGKETKYENKDAKEKKMMDIDFRINSHKIELGYILSRELIKSCKLKPIDIFVNQLKVERDEVFYWSKNCEVSFMQKSILLVPCLGLNYSVDEIFGTSVFCWFKNDKLSKVAFQIIDNRIVSEKFLRSFREETIKLFGQFRRDNNPDFPNNDIIYWTDNKSRLISELSASRKSAFVWFYIE